MDLSTPINQLPKIGPIYAARLKKLGISTALDFLYHVPFRYDDYSLISPIATVQEGETVTIQGTVLEIKNEYIRRFRTLQKATIEDATGTIDVVWFNQPFLVKNIIKGTKISLAGKVTTFRQKPILESPEYEVVTDQTITIHTGRFVPIYPETRGISSKWLRRQIYQILYKQKGNLFEYIPYSIIKREGFMGFIEAIEQIHFPKDKNSADLAKQRLAFDEFFLLQMAVLKRKMEWNSSMSGYPFAISRFRKQIQDFWQKLPFELTFAQKKAVKEIFADLAGTRPMNRLLEGDVGSGKTVVAAIAMYLSHLNNFQSVLMAPTEILANQHYETISHLLSPLGVKVGLVTSSRKFSILDSQFSILVGTHALLFKKLDFNKIRLVVIDEQQRFGVEQRALVRKKGKNPHFLTMTATPIPRTVALTLYGDLDLSFLDEMPKGRKEIKTWLVPPEKRENAYKWVISQLLTLNPQLFVICPFIEQSESLKSVKAATLEFDRLKKEVFTDFKLGLLHGKLKHQEKESAINNFRNGTIDILVATPVVEVGIDIPNAAIIIIEAAERFGLAQLHQLRGRVGRSDKQSYCLLFTESKEKTILKRLKALEVLHIGAQLAELDLKLRGPGEIYGTMQHGLPTLKVATFNDATLIKKARVEAEKILPQLDTFPLLKEKLKSYTIQQVAPD
ncbi:ATP-dependent DNA helicase RecG [Candidatus Microgenomates bacterium]|nr:ATP-dependent DNA helicase RecG [Candidatus Microgenomates bacterium]